MFFKGKAADSNPNAVIPLGCSKAVVLGLSHVFMLVMYNEAKLCKPACSISEFKISTAPNQTSLVGSKNIRLREFKTCISYL